MLSYKDLLAEQGALLDEMADRHVEVQKSIDAAVIKDQTQMISRAMQEIYNQANTWFIKYAGAEGISVSEAKKRAAAADIELLSKKAAAYSANRHYKEFAFSEQANAEMALFNLTMKTSRAELQLRELQLSMIKLNDDLSLSTFNHLYSNTETELVRLAGIMGKSVLTGSNIASVTETIVNNKGQYGTDFRDTIWNNVSGAQKVLEAGIRQSLIQGKNPRTWASSLKGYIDQTQLFLDKKIETIAITETAMRQDEARKLIAERAGFTFYRIRTERDSRRCEICAHFDEYIGSYKDLAEGVNAPLFHARCRCQADPYEYTEEQNDEDFAALEDYVNRLRATNSIEQVKEELYGYDPVAWLGAGAPQNILPAVVYKPPRVLGDAAEPIKLSMGSHVNEYFYGDDGYIRWKDSLSDKEKTAATEYTSHIYKQINSYNRGNFNWAPDGAFGSVIDDAEKFMANPPDISPQQPGESFFEYKRRKNSIIPQEYQNALASKQCAIENNELLDGIIDRYELKDNLRTFRAIEPDALPSFDKIDDLIGQPYTDKSFMSTSPTLDSRAVNKNYIMEITVPKGVGNGAYLEEFTAVNGEYEFLLPRNREFKITGVRVESGKNFIKMEMLP